MTALLIIGMLLIAGAAFGVSVWAFDKFDVPLCVEGCKEWGCEHPKLSGTVDDIKPGSSNGRAAGLHPASRGSIPLSGTGS